MPKTPSIPPSETRHKLSATAASSSIRSLQEKLSELGYLRPQDVTGRSHANYRGAIKTLQYEMQICATETPAIEERLRTLNAAGELNSSRRQVVQNLDRRQFDLSDDQLAAIMPDATAEARATFLPKLNSAMQEFCIDTPARKAAFLAQVAAETSQLQFTEELGAKAALHGKYAGFHGRGLLQLTWKHNYEEAGKALGVDLRRNPSLVSKNPLVAARTAAWFFSSRGLNELADLGQFGKLVLKVNGGYRGIDERLNCYDRALKVLSPKNRAGNFFSDEFV